jgi:hypothetical protein
VSQRALEQEVQIARIERSKAEREFIDALLTGPLAGPETEARFKAVRDTNDRLVAAKERLANGQSATTRRVGG